MVLRKLKSRLAMKLFLRQLHKEAKRRRKGRKK